MTIKEKQISLVIPSDLHKRAKIKAIKQDITLKEFMTNKLEEWLKND